MENFTKLDHLENDYSYLAPLDINQKIAVTCTSGNQVVIGGPGTGKTHIIAYRVLHLINEGVDPSKIYLITFTRKAAQSMQQRIKQLMPDITLGYVGTFHTLASKIIAEDNFITAGRLIDNQDNLALVDLTCDSGPIGSSKLMNIFTYFTNTGKPMKQVLTDLQLEKYIDYSEKIEQAYQHYMDTKKRIKYLTYDDLISTIVHNPRLAKKIDIEYLMVDEYQDITKLQLDFIKVLASTNVMVLGDDFQNIYSFRGTDNSLLIDFDKHFNDVKLVELAISYRATPQIANSLNKIVSQTKFGYCKYITSALEDDNNDITIYGGLEQYTPLIISHIRSNKQTHGIIYRRNKMRSLVEQELIKQNIPYQIYGGINLLEREHIKDLISIISLINNPGDYIAHLQVLKLWGIDEQQAVKMVSTINFKDYENLPTSSLLTSELGTVGQILNLATEYYFSLFKEATNEKVINEDFDILRKLASGYNSIIGFINDFTLESKIDYNNDESKQPRVILSNVHASKGLEFDNVHFICGFNKFKEMPLIQMEEEARIFYVGLSRAKKAIYIYDNISPARTLNDMINDFIDSPKRENYSITYDNPRISDVSKVTILLDQDNIEYEINENHRFDLKSILNFFRK